MRARSQANWCDKKTERFWIHRQRHLLKKYQVAKSWDNNTVLVTSTGKIAKISDSTRLSRPTLNQMYFLQLNYKIRSKAALPSAQARKNDGTGCRSTDDFPENSNFTEIWHCNPTNYYYSGFLTLQAAIDFTWLSVSTSFCHLFARYFFSTEISSSRTDIEIDFWPRAM